MYITINNIIGEKKIDLSYPIHSNKEALGPHWPTSHAGVAPLSSRRSAEIAVIRMLSDNIQYEVVKPHTIVDNVSGDKKLNPSETYAGRKLLCVLEGMVAIT